MNKVCLQYDITH